MQTPASSSAALQTLMGPPDDTLESLRLEARLPPLLSVIAGMVDLTGFFTLGNVFTAHITGNLVLAAAAVVRGGPLHLAQLLAIPVFMLALVTVWLIARASDRHGPRLARLLLQVQFLLLAAVWILSVLTKPSADPHGFMAGIAVMLAVSAMACQYAVFRLAIPETVSTAVMTGNLTNTVLSLMDTWSTRRLLAGDNAARLKKSLRLLFGFFGGCVVAAAAVSFWGDWAWTLPVALAAIATALR
jgi:uncharacterized membrane protein YoaK (UPF0700 family)